MYRLLALVLLFGIFGMASSCGASSRYATADFCVAVDVHAKEDEALFSLFDQFARDQLLVSDSSGTVSREYRSPDRKVVIAIDLGMGQFGAILSFYRFDEDAGQSVLDALGMYVEKEIASRWKVTACADIEGFRTPQIFE